MTLLLEGAQSVTNVSDWGGFEEELTVILEKAGFRKVDKDCNSEDNKKNFEYLQKIKPQIQDKTKPVLLKNELYAKELNKDGTKNSAFKNFFVWQPYGSQNFPDFIIFTEKAIFSVEAKFSTKGRKKPIWNGNIPKQNSIYIFGSTSKTFRDLTIFKGSNIIDEKATKALVDFWKEQDKLVKKFNSKMNELTNNGEVVNEGGFSPYLRQTYCQHKLNNHSVTDYFSNPKRKEWEQSVIDFAKKNE